MWRDRKGVWFGRDQPWSHSNPGVLGHEARARVLGHEAPSVRETGISSLSKLLDINFQGNSGFVDHIKF